MKRKLIIMIPLFFLFACFAGCSRNHENDVMVMFPPLQIEVPYHPLDVNKMPDWLQKKVKKGECWMVCQGYYDGQKVYNVRSSFSSHIGGSNYDYDGRLLDISDDAVSHWFCIFIATY